MSSENERILWYSPAKKPFELNGFPFFEQDGLYRRLQKNPPKAISASVDSLADNTAGGQIRFKATFKELRIKAKLYGKSNMYHMAPTGQSGFDCYLSRSGTPRYFSTASFLPSDDSYECVLAEFAEPMELNVVINFPLYMGVYEVLLGFDDKASISHPESHVSSGKIVVYGTSITQGGCATRPGMCYTNILSRMMNREIINLGFSGNGRCESEMAIAIREIDNMDLFILDTEANCQPDGWISQYYPQFLKLFREVKCEVPILVMTKVPYAQEQLRGGGYCKRCEYLKLQQKIVDDFVSLGDRNIYLLSGETLVDDCFEENSVDGVHMTDLGFIQVARGLKPIIEKLLK